MPSHFAPFGPFPLGLAADPLEAKELKSVWAAVESATEGLQDAIGIYILAVGQGKENIPLYVGKAEHGFRMRLKPGHDAFRKAGHKHSGQPLSVLFLARVTNKTGKFVRQRKTNEHNRSITDLEVLLIRDFLSRGFELVNSAGKKFYEELVVPGYLHDAGVAKTNSSEFLRKLLATKVGRVGVR